MASGYSSQKLIDLEGLRAFAGKVKALYVNGTVKYTVANEEGLAEESQAQVGDIVQAQDTGVFYQRVKDSEGTYGNSNFEKLEGNEGKSVGVGDLATDLQVKKAVEDLQNADTTNKNDLQGKIDSLQSTVTQNQQDLEKEIQDFKKNLGTAAKQTITEDQFPSIGGESHTATVGDIYEVDDPGKDTDNHYLLFVGQGQPGADANGFIDLGESVEFGDFATRAAVDAHFTEAAKTYATKDEVASLGVILGDCTHVELEGKKSDNITKKGDSWVVTDRDNHIFYYNGDDFVDLGGSIETDLAPYLKSSEAQTTYLTQTEAGNVYLKKSDTDVATEDDINGLFAE